MLQLAGLTVKLSHLVTEFLLQTTGFEKGGVFFLKYINISGPHINIKRQIYSLQSNNKILAVLHLRIFEKL